jgi:hypothetical protein
MTAKPKIKVIKKGEVKLNEKPAVTEKQSKQKQAREMVSTVSNWVNDFQQRKRVETRQAFENLFAAQPKASEV